MTYFPPDQDFKAATEQSMNEFLPERILNFLWSSHFYYFSWIESINVVATDSGGDTVTLPGAWDTATDGSASFSFGSTGAVLSTGATSGSDIALGKRPLSQTVLRWDKIQRFRTAFRISATTNQTGYLIRGGQAISGSGLKYFGFRISGNALQGTVENNNASTRTNLALGVTLSADTTYDVEARLFPGQKVIFYVKNSTTGIYEQKGVITTTGAAGIPTGGATTDFFEFSLVNSAAEAKSMTVSFVEYIQQR